MAGFAVTRDQLDPAAAEAVLAVRTAFDRVEVVANWLGDSSSASGDILEVEFGYSREEAYLLRLVFEQLNAARLAAADTMVIARKLTGLR